MLLAFVIMLHFGVATVLSGRETAVRMLGFFSSTVPMVLQVLVVIRAQKPAQFTAAWLGCSRVRYLHAAFLATAAAMLGASCMYF